RALCRSKVAPSRNQASNSCPDAHLSLNRIIRASLPCPVLHFLQWFSNWVSGVLTSRERPVAPTDPSPWVTRFLGLIRQGGRLLDLAAGGGRHTRLLRAHGHRVLAVD